MTGHWLARMLAPRSVALIGASPRPDTLGRGMVDTVRKGYGGGIFAVNPRYREVHGLECRASLAALPEVPDLAILGVGARQLETVIEEAISIGVGGAVVFNRGIASDGSDPGLVERLRARCREARFPLCGGNGMGFYNFDLGLMASFIPPPDSTRAAGGITLLAHSGSVFVMLASSSARYRFNLAISPGQELGATVADYADYALALPTTRVLALFVETIRDPGAFIAALEKARERDIPVVVLKVGRTEESARLARSHSGAIAGNDAAFTAVCERYGALRARNFDELMASAVLLAQSRRAGPGALAAVLDSGGLRELMIDLATDIGVPFAEIGETTISRLRARLEPGLDPVNPLDAAGAWSEGFAGIFEDCLDALMADPGTAIGGFEFEARDALVYVPRFLEIAKAAGARHHKPFFVLNSFTGTLNDRLATELAETGVPLINGVQNALVAVQHALAYRDFQARSPSLPGPTPPASVVDGWRRRLRQPLPLGEAPALALLQAFGVPASETVTVEDVAALTDASEALGFPLALKCAMPGVLHKSDVNGVHLNLGSLSALTDAYRDLCERLGPCAIVQPMAPAGIELAFGLLSDPQFGPLVMVASGGIWVEVLKDRCFAVAPVDEAEAARLLDRLAIRPRLERAGGGAHIATLAQALARFSVLAATYGDEIAEMDVNPVIASASGCIAVDALVIARDGARPP